MILQGLVRIHKVPINLLSIATKGTVYKSMSCRSISWDNILSDSQVQRINQRLQYKENIGKLDSTVKNRDDVNLY